jgi:cytoskeletal protein RodZ
VALRRLAAFRNRSSGRSFLSRDQADVVFCLALGLVAVIIWIAITAWMWNVIGGITLGE